METIHRIQSEEAIKLLGDPIRLGILRILIAKEATLSQLGTVFHIHPAQVRNHIKQLEKNGLVELASIQMSKNYIEKYYRASAKMFLLNMAVLPEPLDDDQLVILASDDLALNLLVETINQKSGKPLIYSLPVGSLNALIYLKEKYCQIAGCHLIDAETGEYNVPYIHHLFSDQKMVVMNLVHRQQGLMVKKGNPSSITGLQDILREDVVFINRNRGSGTRLWLDQQIKRLDFSQDLMHYTIKDASTHSEVAEAVKSGSATTGLGIYTVTEKFDLDFIPLFNERYDLVMTAETYQSPLFRTVLETMQSIDYQERVMGLGGYIVTDMGKSLTI